ncbi:cyclic peptide transporter [Flavobacterium sp. CF108]|uniref:cyclic peptide export ABC transporter n=1 Tax=unclassified Flavobacterium TaxID=196869 RepID=UPI0008BB5D2D|nr:MULTISPECIES: cyclic peptide export ABC transporter [unclassified Flavobacterium]SEO95038.1 cyclic peptide transporter [Flavobacterium sp. fv08]SHH82317.1 cyclic peptide transporter [Flavobacterium sp. CF108]
MENIIYKLYLINGIIALLGLVFFGLVIFQKINKKREVDFSYKKVYSYFKGFLVLLPVLVALYYIPIALYDKDFWLDSKYQYVEAQNAVLFLGIIILGFYALVRISTFFPHKNEYYDIGSQLLLLSLFPGIASAINVMIISKFVTDDIEAKYLLFFFAVTTFIYIVTVRLSKRKTASLGILIAHKFNIIIANKIFKIPYRKYEKLAKGKIYTILNDDINAIFGFSQNVVNIYTTFITTVMVLVYMFTLNIISSLMLIGVTVIILGLLFLMSGRLKRTGHKARSKRENYTSLLSGLLNGFKELVLHKVKRDRFQSDLKVVSKDYYDASQENINAGIDAALFSELSFTIAVGVSCLVFPVIFDFNKELVTAYVIAVLYLWGPVGALISGVPQIINVQVSWKRINDFLENADVDEVSYRDITEEVEIVKVEKISVNEVYFKYQGENDKQDITYGIGPINFEADRGELVFIIGGNGSGKTTFLKLLIGLYEPESGEILINGKVVTSKELSECFSVIYSDFYLFKKIYDIKENRLDQVYEWLDVLQLSDKVKIEDGVFSTIDLSKGQCKRLAILKSYLEDRSVYFFDEVAADLDPEFRDFFYNDLLTKMRNEGKILIIITHDDKYFDIADNIYKMEMGKIVHLNKEAFKLSEHI